jgi:hypothetical protein
MKRLKPHQLSNGLHDLSAGLHNTFHSFVFSFFKSINRRIRSKLPLWRMKEETSEHVQFAVKMFKKFILPMSIVYIIVDLLLFGRNAFDSALWGSMVFFYSSFLPDLPSVFRKKKRDRIERGLPWYKKYALLLFSPLFLLFLFSGQHLGWRTTETFHNFKSMAVYEVFLLLLGVFLFGNLPMSIGRITEIISLSLYGAAGYAAHMKVDKIWFL